MSEIYAYKNTMHQYSPTLIYDTHCMTYEHCLAAINLLYYRRSHDPSMQVVEQLLRY